MRGVSGRQRGAEPACYLDRFTLAQSADPPLQSYVAEARAGLARLTGE